MKAFYLISATLALGSCTVYSPMQCAAPALRDKGEVEVSATLHANTRMEGSVAYSPIKHGLVRVAGSFKNARYDTTYFRVRQFEVAAGGYLTPTEYWTLGGLAGYGQAHNQRGFLETSGLFGPALEDRARRYDANYHTVFGEAFATYQRRKLGGGMAVRLTNVQFDQLTDRGTPFGPAAMTRLEPMLFMRLGPYDNKADFIKFQLSFGLSVATNGSPSDDIDTRNIRETTPRLAASVMLYPHRLWRE
jgi:hypothetical protein